MHILRLIFLSKHHSSAVIFSGCKGNFKTIMSLSGSAAKDSSDEEPVKVIYKLRDRSSALVATWAEHFKDHIDTVMVSEGDIFKDAPAADALVSPANSFGFMNGGIDGAYSLHFGWQMQERLQRVIRSEHHGEILVGNSVIIPTFEGGAKESSMDWSSYNEGQPIKYLISAPTMRVPMNVSKTSNAYLAFRGIILAVNEHNRRCKESPIRSVLCPGLGTAVGRMPLQRCAYQMLEAYETFECGTRKTTLEPDHLEEMWLMDENMARYGEAKK